MDDSLQALRIHMLWVAKEQMITCVNCTDLYRFWKCIHVTSKKSNHSFDVLYSQLTATLIKCQYIPVIKTFHKNVKHIMHMIFFSNFRRIVK